jgi:hypothetical protein
MPCLYPHTHAKFSRVPDYLTLGNEKNNQLFLIVCFKGYPCQEIKNPTASVHQWQG